MSKIHTVISVFTARGLHRIISERGSQAWVLDAKRASVCELVVCVQNRGFPDDWGQATAEHKEAFVVGKVKRVVLSEQENASEGRYMIEISEYAEISVRDAWPGNRNPVRYTTLQEMGIDFDSLVFHSVPDAEIPQVLPNKVTSEKGLSIAEAKAGIALRFGIKPEQVQITVTA